MGGGRVGIGLRAAKGRSVLVAMVLDGGRPHLLLSTFLSTAAEGDRLALEPFAVAFGMPRGADGKASQAAAEAVAEGRRRQNEQATAGLGAIIDMLRGSAGDPAVAALLVNRAGWVTDLLDYSLGWPDHVPVAEGLAVRDALRCACAAHALPLIELDEKSLYDIASAKLAISAENLDSQLRQLGAMAGKPWRKEQKAACLSAWLALSDAP